MCVHFREDLPYVLRSINLQTRPAEKIGIVGRTGSGKSSLFTALARLVEISSGKICIDTVDIKKVNLRDLRSKLCIIPQDPLIFSGTLMENLDPLGKRPEAQIVKAVEKCQLLGLVHTLGGLDQDVGENGHLLSTGQKQLVCLARAILVNAKVCSPHFPLSRTPSTSHSRMRLHVFILLQILCIDEATANVDQETDKVIQTTLRNYFGQTTVITIAHRVPTVLHCDR